MKVVTFGVFDYLHYGHLTLFKKAKEYGEYLIVALHEDEEIHKTKPQAKVLYNLKTRMEFVNELKCVDEVISYKAVADDIKNIDFDVFVVGEDQNHEGFQKAIKWANENNKKVVIINRVGDISSSKIKQDLNI